MGDFSFLSKLAWCCSSESWLSLSLLSMLLTRALLLHYLHRDKVLGITIWFYKWLNKMQIFCIKLCQGCTSYRLVHWYRPSRHTNDDNPFSNYGIFWDNLTFFIQKLLPIRQWFLISRTFCMALLLLVLESFQDNACSEMHKTKCVRIQIATHFVFPETENHVLFLSNCVYRFFISDLVTYWARDDNW